MSKIKQRKKTFKLGPFGEKGSDPTVKEGTIVTSWPDGSLFGEIYVRVNKDK